MSTGDEYIKARSDGSNNWSSTFRHDERSRQFTNTSILAWSPDWRALFRTDAKCRGEMIEERTTPANTADSSAVIHLPEELVLTGASHAVGTGGPPGSAIVTALPFCWFGSVGASGIAGEPYDTPRATNDKLTVSLERED